MPPPRIRPIEKFAKAVGKCTTEASEYGKCVVTDYNNVYKDKCLGQFMKLQKCVRVASKKV
ncbi:hypothetical protein BGX38DRAFT_1219655 [Terfezia claveryi]|nr:hypothetical protein BGX38DRAFT_1219655 [Terfezia claveryi]